MDPSIDSQIDLNPSQNRVKHEISVQKTKLIAISDEDRNTLKEFIITTVGTKLREALHKLSFDQKTDLKNENNLDQNSSEFQLYESRKDETLDSKVDEKSKPLIVTQHKKEINPIVDIKQIIDSNNATNNSIIDSSLTETQINRIKGLTLEFQDNFECSICYEMLPFLNCGSFGCSHIFCKKCISQHLTTSILDGRIESLKCPQNDCHVEASDGMIEKLVPLRVFQRYHDLRLRKAVGKMDDIFYCPHPGCQALVPCEIDVGLGVCYECNFNFCTNCLKPFHGTIDCYLSETEEREMILKYIIDEKSENQIITNNLKHKETLLQQDLASQKLINRIFKKCPGCRSDVEKHEGCNHMVCTVCRTEFCWLCLEKFANDQQMKSHYNSKCLLFEYHLNE